ncbi:Uncharacterised protein [Ectopseudomonas mendocina]|uniref:Uncharacterized protein n=1 Tax=Ectopseudomonas mendocina TaxID=300 RepID=A0A379PLJ3_ECTME|nr:hypothetical protein [Pseudomonas mendocina]SUE95841.1 Uncharacterised protein [Pseudomonas mendocina]
MTQKSVESIIAVSSYDDAALLLEDAVNEVDLGSIKIFLTDGSAGRKVVVLNAMDSDASAIIDI